MKASKDEIIRLYKEENLSIHEISRRLSVRRPTISDVLNKAGVERTKKPRKKKYVVTETPDYSFLEGKVLVCKKTGEEFSDVLNKSGGITQHIRDLYPDEFAAQFSSKWNRMMMAKTGTLWYLPFFDVVYKTSGGDETVDATKPTDNPNWVQEVIRLYTEENLSTHAVAERMKVGHKKISEVLKAHNVPIRNRGKQVKYDLTEEADNSYLEGKILVCKETGKQFSDVFNVSGALTNHILTLHPDIEIPSAYKRRMMAKTGKIWHLDFFNIAEPPNEVIPTRKCKYCKWETTDVENKTGCYEVHLMDIHKKDIASFIEEFPEEAQFHPKYVKRKEQEEFLQEEQNFVVCQLCNQRFRVITNLHLKNKHGITQEEYKLRFNTTKIVSDSRSDLFRERFKQMNIDGILKSSKSSSYEDDLEQFLKSLNIPYEKNNRKILDGIEIDFYLPTLQIGIEHHGLKWHTDNFGKRPRLYHFNKMKSCEEKGIHLIQIFEDEMCEKREIVFKKLTHIFGKNNNVEIIHARKCEIREIDSVVKNVFLNKNHIQGENKSPIKLGAFYNNRLIAVMCFDNQRGMNRTKEKNDTSEYELSRFCVDMDVICNGIANKLLKHFIRTYNPTKIMSMADKRWTKSGDNLYTKLNFIQVASVPPDYWYYNEKHHRTKRVHKFNFGKQAIQRKFNIQNIDEKTEMEWMKEFGWDWVWDCGKLKYEMEIKKD